MNSNIRLALFLGLLFAAGCGQKGPLFLPDDPSQIKVGAPRQEQSQTGEDDEDDKDKEEESQDENE